MLWGLLLALLATACRGDSFHELLEVRPLADRNALVKLTFTTHAPWDASHVEYMPLPLALVVHRFNVHSLTVTLAAGRWRAERWELEPAAAPAGLVVRARFAGALHTVPARWEALLQALGGLLGASMGFAAPHTVARDAFEREAMLPREAVCTENLTPWAALLPCPSDAGLRAIISPAAVFDSSHHTLALHYTRHSGLNATLVQQLLYVTAHPAARWTHRNLFANSSSVLRACALATSSEVFVDLAEQPKATGTSRGLHSLGSSSLSLDLLLPAASAARPRVNVWRHASGLGRERGSMVSVLQAREAVRVIYTEVVPWYVMAHFHTLRVVADGVLVEAPLIRHVTLSSLRGPPAVLELELDLRANSTTHVSWDFAKAFLKLAEHPPDAHHGFHLPAATLRDLDGATLVVSDVVVVTMPLPDFSMPFNVVALTGVVLSFFFGAALRAVTARYSTLRHGDTAATASQRPIARIARLLLRLIDGE